MAAPDRSGPAPPEDARSASPVAALASGGLDSAVLLAHLAATGATVHPLYVRCGLAWEEAEVARLGALVAALRRPAIRAVEVLQVPMREAYGPAWYASGRGIPGYRDPDEDWQIPGRNIVLLTSAAVWGAVRGIGRLALGILASNPFPDATPEFFAALEDALSRGLGRAIEVLRPFAGVAKEEVIRRGAELRVPFELTLTCARPEGDLHCGTCGKCRERIEAFAAAAVPDPTRYAARGPRA